MKKIFFGSYLLLATLVGNAQSVGIGTNTPNTSAILDLSSTSKGALIPRMTTVQRNAIVTPTQGLMIFNLDDQCTDIYDGTNWIKNCGLKQTGTTTIAANSWTRKSDLGGMGRLGAVSFTIGGKGYIATGETLPGTFSNELWEYDTLTNSWQQKANFAGSARAFAVAFSIGGSGYLGTGRDPTFKSDFWEYKQTSNVWTQLADFGYPRTSATGFSIGTKGYIGTGYDGNYHRHFREFDPATNTWTDRANFPGEGLYGNVSVSVNGRAFSGFGLIPSAGTNSDQWWEYDPVSDSWSEKTSLTWPFGSLNRRMASGFAIGSKAYISTGIHGVSFSDLWEYDPVGDTWTKKADFTGGGRYAATGFSIGSKGYLGTGSVTGSGLKDFWQYNPAAYSIPTYSGLPATINTSQLSDGIWTRSTSNDLRSSGNIVTILNSGRLGIGTMSPGFPINLANQYGDKISLFGEFGPHYGFGVQPGFLQIYTTNAADQIIFGSGSSEAFDEKMRIDGSGNLGIGTPSPVNRISVAGNMDLSGLLGVGISNPTAPLSFSHTGGNKISFFGDAAGNHYGVGIDAGLLQFYTDLTSSDIVFGTGRSAAFTERVRIKGTGHVGIGTNNPTRPLSFPAQTGEKILLFPGAQGEVGIGVYPNELRLHTDYSMADITFGHQSNSPVFTETMRIKGNGNVGIGNSNPTRPLSFPALTGEKILLYPSAIGEYGIGVYSNELRIHGDGPGVMITMGSQDNVGNFSPLGRFQNIAGHVLYVYGDIWANGVSYASDARFKENISVITSPLEKLQQIEGVMYQMKSEEFPANRFRPGLQMGLLAQNVEKVAPEAVNEVDGYKSVDYARLVPLLIESIKAQQKQIDDLKKQLKEK